MNNFNAKELKEGDILKLDVNISRNNFITFGSDKGELVVEVVLTNDYLFTVKDLFSGEEYSFLTSSFDTTKNIFNHEVSNGKIRVKVSKIKLTFWQKIKIFFNKFV